MIDDASLHSAPTYVHCKAGKSRSVTAVMAYLIHANHWTLSRAYTFVLERRKGISPNIGFVSELMNFEEAELGNKSVGVIKQPQSAGGAGSDCDQLDGDGSNRGTAIGIGLGGRRPSHMRESLPPAWSAGAGTGGALPSVPRSVDGDVGQEMEVKDATGRYRHARRAPVDENTLQPMRRVSKAGLESTTSVEP
jgi:Dual specificity phosphatase, catalytic domain